MRRTEPRAARAVPPHGTPEERAWARRQAWRGTVYVLLPFLLILALSLNESILGMRRAALTLTTLAAKMAQRGSVETTGAAAERLSRELYPDGGADAERHESLARLVALRVEAVARTPQEGAGAPSWLLRRWSTGESFCPRGDDPVARFCRATFVQLLRDSWAIMLAKVMLLLFFPVLFVASFWQAYRGILDPPGALEPPTQAAVGRRFESFTCEIRYRRYRRLLKEQDRSFLVRRLAFAMLMAYGIAYVVAPLGHQAMAIGEFRHLYALPGEPTYPFLFESFSQAPLFSVGFAGFLVFALARVGRRFADEDLSDRVLLSLFLRGLTVLLLTFILPSVGEQDLILRPLVFAVGMIPKAGFELLAKVTKVKADEVAGEENTGFVAIPEIDFYKESSLHELGIHDYHDLAKEDLKDLLPRVGTNPGVLLRGADRSILYHVLGAEAGEKLAAVPISTASELVVHIRGVRPGDLPPAEQEARERQVAAKLGVEDLHVKLDELLHDRNVGYVLEKRAAYGSV